MTRKDRQMDFFNKHLKDLAKLLIDNNVNPDIVSDIKLDLQKLAGDMLKIK